MRTIPAVFLLSLLMVGCTPRKKTPPGPPDSLPIDLHERAAAICQRLEAAHAAKNCSEVTGSSKAGWLTVHFDPVAGEKNQGLVTVFFGSKYDDDGGLWPLVDYRTPAGDDYPHLYMTSPPGLTWGQWRIQWGPQKWEDCRKGSPVAACAKKYPAEYASSKAIYEAAKRIAAGG